MKEKKRGDLGKLNLSGERKERSFQSLLRALIFFRMKQNPVGSALIISLALSNRIQGENVAINCEDQFKS